MTSLKKSIMHVKWYPSTIYNKIILKTRKVKVKPNLNIYGRLVVKGRGEIQIGSNVTINSCRDANPRGGVLRTILFAKKNGIIKIGSQCGISNTAICCLNSITIEEKVFIGSGCKIYDHDFHSVYLEKRLSIRDDDIKNAPVLIKRGAFIGAHSIILKGVTIGEESVIGAGSVVTKNIPDREVWAGNPAKFIKKL